MTWRYSLDLLRPSLSAALLAPLLAPLLAARFAVALIVLATLLSASLAQAGRIEAGTFTAHDTFDNPNPVRVTFQQSFDVPPIVVVLSNNVGSNSAAMQITNVTTTGFDELIREADAFDGPHLAKDTHYIAVEPGRHLLPGGAVIEAGRISTAAVQRGSGVGGPATWQSVSFSSPLPTTPSVISQIQTANSETRPIATQTSQPFITATLSALSTSGFLVALERSEANQGPTPSTETIGWIAFPSGANGTFTATNSDTIQWSALTTTANIRGWDDGCFTNGFGLTSVVIAKKVTRNGGDGGWLRRCSLSSSQIGLVVDEDTARDTERSHTGESASIFAFSQSFHANLAADLDVTKVRLSVDDGRGGDFGIPGALVTYLITVRNAGNAPPDPGTLIVTESIPTGLKFVVTDLSGTGSGPVEFAQGSPATGLTCAFVALTAPSDCLFFSTDGLDFSYSPSDSGDGTDEDVRFIQIRPSGFMNGDSGSGAPQFTLRMRARIDPQ